MDVGLHDHRVQRDVDASSWLEQGREERTLTELGDLDRQVTRGGGHGLGSGAVAVRGAFLGALVWCGADHRGGFGIDQGLEHEAEHLTHHIAVVSGAQCLGELEQGRLVQGHRVSPVLRVD